MKARDKVTIEVTGRQLAKILAVMGRANGPTDATLYHKAERLLGRRWNSELIPSSPCTGTLNYNSYYKEWEAYCLDPEETEEERKIRELEETIKKAQEQIQALKEGK